MTRRVFAAAAIVALAACNPKSPNGGVSPAPSLSPGVTPSPVALRIIGRGSKKQPVRIIETKANRKQFEIISHSYQSEGAVGAVTVMYNDVNINFFSKDGSTLVATAPHATIDQRTNLVVLTGGVHAHNSAGMTLQCDRLTYDRATEMIHGDGNVVITNPNGFRGTGNHFDSNTSLTNATMQ